MRRNVLRNMSILSIVVNHISHRLFRKSVMKPIDEEILMFFRFYNFYVIINCPIENSKLHQSQNFDLFTKKLNNAQISYKTFKSKGIDIKAACGHLIFDVVG